MFVQCAAALGRRMTTEIKGNERQRAAYGFRLCVARPPTSAEVDLLVQLYHENLAIYQQDPAAARVFPIHRLSDELPTDAAAAKLAAWSVVGNVLLNLDETLTKY